MGGGGEEGGEKEGALSPDRIAATVERLVDARLQELTAQRVKTLVEAVMKANLGWLVVWGNMCVAGTRSQAGARRGPSAGAIIRRRLCPCRTSPRSDGTRCLGSKGSPRAAAAAATTSMR